LSAESTSAGEVSSTSLRAQDAEKTAVTVNDRRLSTGQSETRAAWERGLTTSADETQAPSAADFTIFATFAVPR
jgi:hypothetical protein